MREMNDVTIARSRKRELRSAARCSSQLPVSSGKQRQQVCCAAVSSLVILGHCCYVPKWLLQTADCFPSIWLIELYFGSIFVCVATSIVRGIRSTCSWFRCANSITLNLFVVFVQTNAGCELLYQLLKLVSQYREKGNIYCRVSFRSQ
jgi:hypothetical protein